MDTLSVQLTRERDKIRNKRNLNKIKRQRHNKKLQILMSQHTNINGNIVPEFKERQSRSLTKNSCKKRNGSLPIRKNKIYCQERIRVMQESETGKKWLHPFINKNKNIPIMEIQIDNIPTICTVDTGSTRIMITSAMAKTLWGNDSIGKLQNYPRRSVEDAQGNPVKVLGFKETKIELGIHLTAYYPIVVYEAEHKELLLGYTFLKDYNLAIYCGTGIGPTPQIEVIRRLNFSDQPLECFSIQEHMIPPKAIKVIKAKIKLPHNWDKQDQMAIIGTPVVSHSEDLEEVNIQHLQCPYTYDIIDVDYTINVLLDNTDNLEPLMVHKNTKIAHAEIVNDQVSNDQVKRIFKENWSIDQDTQAGEYELQDEKEPNRYDYLQNINVKTDEKGIEAFCKNLLTETESFWSKSTFDMGKFDRKARITLKNTIPVRDKYRPVNPKKEAQAQEIIDQLEKHNLISRANSPYCSQPVWVWKKPKDKTGKEAIAGEQDFQAPRALRLALDYRKLNKVISSDCHFPNPSIKEILFKLKKAKYITIADLTNSYWHVELTEATKPLLAFQTSTAQFVWNRLPQGTAPSMSIMAEAINDTIVTGGIADICMCYVDNLIIMSNSIEQHKKDLNRVIKVFMSRGWKANPSKTHFFIDTECRLFGFHINLKTQTMGPDPQKVQGILQLPPPTNQKTARSFAGSINYYSDLIPDLAPLMAPIHDTTRDGKFEWTTECNTNFEIIKRKLAKLPTIYLADFDQPMHLFTDAAQGQFLGYHIAQYRSDMKKYVPIAWGSHKFNSHEKTMSQPEAELFAIVYAIMQESLLLGFSKIIVHTDCRSLTYLFKFTKICSKLMRWQLILSSFDIEIYFEPSDSIGIKISDMLSRRPEKRMTNRRPKPEEIAEIPNIKLDHKPILTFLEAKEEIEKQLINDPPHSPETIKYFMEKWVHPMVKPEDLKCNKDILLKVIKEDDPIDKGAEQYQHQYVYTPEHLAFKNDISPSGRLINLVLEEAPGLSLDVLKHHQLSDPYFGPKMKQMIDSGTPLEEYALKQGILLKISKDPITSISYQICVPRSLSLELIGKFHYSVFGSHPDLKKLMTNLKKRFFIKQLKAECQQVLRTCQVCSLNKSYNIMKQPYGTKIAVTGPRQLYALDICTVDTQAKMEDLPTSFLIVTDCWCLYTIAIPINSDATAQEILEKFSMNIIQPFGIPKIGITTDGGKNFSNNLANTFSAVLGLQQFRIAPYNARANPAERVNRAILAGLRYASQQFHLKPEIFKNLLNYIVLSWNTSVLSHLNFSPYQLFLSTPYEPAALTSFVTIHEAEKDYGDFIEGLVKTQHLVENLVNQKFKETRDKRNAKKKDKSKHSIYSPGMQVMIKNQPDHTIRAHKLRPRFSGPYKIIREFQNNVEVIPWMVDRKVKLVDKYKNEARNIPKFEKMLVSKDRIKPCSEITFYYDDALARRFYQEFWDTVRDTQPIREVQRHNSPGKFDKQQPLKRPFLFPEQIGIKHQKTNLDNYDPHQFLDGKAIITITSDDSDDDDDKDDDPRPQNQEIEQYDRNRDQHIIPNIPEPNDNREHQQNEIQEINLRELIDQQDNVIVQEPEFEVPQIRQIPQKPKQIGKTKLRPTRMPGPRPQSEAGPSTSSSKQSTRTRLPTPIKYRMVRPSRREEWQVSPLRAPRQNRPTINPVHVHVHHHHP